jgi:uncharacterized protein YigA (DUF484 family)
MATQLDLDDVAATSELAKKQLDELRAENKRLIEALERMIEHSKNGIVQAWSALGKE